MKKNCLMLRKILSSQETTKIKQLFNDCKNVVITCHPNPDGDAIGSCLALYEYMTRKGKNARIIVPNYFPDFLKWMHDSDKILLFDRHRAMSKTYFQIADLIIALDYNNLSRIDDMQVPIKFSRAKRIMIDHHTDPELFCDLTISRPKLSSTCELLYRTLIEIGENDKINKFMAEDLYAGMCTDTGRFTYNSNDPEIFIIISELMRKGIDKDLVIRNIYNENTEGRYRLMGHILLNKLELYPDLHSAIFSVTKEELTQFKYLKGDAEGLVNIPLEIKGIKLCISLREDTEKDQIFVSVRSVDNISAHDMCVRYFNGGGHLNASGGRLYCSMQEALDIARSAIESFRTELTSD